MGITRDWRENMDDHAKIMVEVEVWQLKTIGAAMVMRQARMQKVAQDGYDNNDYTFVNAAHVEAEKAYQVGQWAEKTIESLNPDRIEDEWESKDGKLQRAAALADAMDVPDPFYPRDEEF